MASRVPTVDELLERNKAVAQSHKAPPHIGALPKEAWPVSKILIISCADPRCDPSYLFALQQGDAYVLRNVGGRVRGQLGDIVTLDALVGLEHIFVLHHTDCGAAYDTAASVRQGLERLPGADERAIQSLTLPNYDGGEEALRDDVKFLKDSPFLRRELADSVRGFKFDIFTGLLKPIV